MSEPIILTERDPRGVVTVRLNRPEVNNAYNGELVDALIEGLDALRDDPSVRVLVIRGNGRHFQAGADLSWLNSVGQRSEADNRRVSERTASLVKHLNEFPKPTVALIHGACVGGGTGIAASCDVVIASEDAMFAVSEARWGVVAHIIFPQLNAAIGARQVRRYALTCERFDAATAQQLGLVHELCATGQLDATAKKIIDNLLKAAPQAQMDTKRSVMQCAGDQMSADTFDSLVQQHSDKRQTDEAAEGTASFMEKRDPSWYPGK